MDLDGLPMIGTGVDYTQVGAIHQKRTLAFINHFVTNTVSFLNKFSRSCEVRLEKCESRIQKLDASLRILEAKLSSIPGLDDVAHQVPDPVAEEVVHRPSSDLPVPLDAVMKEVPEVSPSSQQSVPPAPSVPVPPVSVPDGMVPANQDPIYKRFFRMLHVGVPEPAVRLKMQAEGLDPNILSNPDQLVPTSAAPTDEADHSSSRQSSSSMSD